MAYPVSPALERLRQEDHDRFKANLGCTVSLKPELHSKIQLQKGKKKKLKRKTV